ncbi:response regulator [Marivivens donghaensis]|uniref:Response regulator n=1 Tax=Marivivens donghaensis TaxID=1699413 RepID=A0ABX0W0Q5_9RHOB|nr:response regulator [Marivivens donghaensis]NIY73913.1 response regulator [Marivivens donghaensis]
MDARITGLLESDAGRVLIVEDEAIIALDLKFIVEDMGLDVMGPAPSVDGGLNAMAESLPTLAILDVNVRGGEVFALADVLQKANVPIIFHSAHATEDELSSRYPGMIFCPKPTVPYQIEDSIVSVLAA